MPTSAHCSLLRSCATPPASMSQPQAQKHTHAHTSFFLFPPFTNLTKVLHPPTHRALAAGPTVYFGKWIRQRLKEAKAAGLVRLAKGSPASHTLKAAAAAQAAGMAPPKPTAFGSSYNPNKYTRRSTDVNDTAGGVAKGKAAGRNKRRGVGVKDTIAAAVGTGPGGVASYVPLVFKPRSPGGGAGGAAAWQSQAKSPAKSRPPPSDQQQQQQQPPSRWGYT
jgi:hypothetical protein